MNSERVNDYPADAETASPAFLRGKGNGDEEGTLECGGDAHAVGPGAGGGHGTGSRDEGGSRAGAVDSVQVLLGLAALFQVCRDGPPDDSAAYLGAMQRAAEVLRTELGA